MHIGADFHLCFRGSQLLQNDIGATLMNPARQRGSQKAASGNVRVGIKGNIQVSLTSLINYR